MAVPAWRRRFVGLSAGEASTLLDSEGWLPLSGTLLEGIDS
jgi:hypothetical protein